MERRLIRRLVGLADAPRETAPLEGTFLAQSLVNTALAELPAEYWGGSLTDTRIARALHALGTGRGMIGNAELARLAGMHPNAFVRKFVQATGHTPHQYHLRLRVERAADRLRRTRLSVEDVAASEGFCDRFHFTRVFAKIMGMGPAAYRRGGRSDDAAPSHKNRPSAT